MQKKKKEFKGVIEYNYHCTRNLFGEKTKPYQLKALCMLNIYFNW